jgi:tetratricopeptide (TPR) repeat protein
MTRAVHRADPQALAASRRAFEPWNDRTDVGHLAHYYIAFAAWREATVAAPPQALALVDQAVEHLEEAVRLRKGFADAHVLLATMYPMYYRLDPARAAIIGPLSTEHLELARLFAPDNPRVVLAEGMSLANRPPDYGGDLQAGLRRIRHALKLFESPPSDNSGIDPDWNQGLAWSWYGQALLRGTAEDRRRARQAFERALEIEPELVSAQRTLRSLDDEAITGER